MNTILDLQDRLQQEMPRCVWACRVLADVDPSAAENTDHIEICASLGGKPLAGCPMHLTSAALTRWGVEATARFICRELSVTSLGSDGTSAWAWDKLAEL